MAQEENIKVESSELEQAFKLAQASDTNKTNSQEDLESRKRLLESILKRRKALDYLLTLG